MNILHTSGTQFIFAIYSYYLIVPLKMVYEDCEYPLTCLVEKKIGNNQEI